MGGGLGTVAMGSGGVREPQHSARPPAHKKPRSRPLTRTSGRVGNHFSMPGTRFSVASHISHPTSRPRLRQRD